MIEDEQRPTVEADGGDLVDDPGAEIEEEVNFWESKFARALLAAIRGEHAEVALTCRRMTPDQLDTLRRAGAAIAMQASSELKLRASLLTREGRREKQRQRRIRRAAAAAAAEQADQVAELEQAG